MSKPQQRGQRRACLLLGSGTASGADGASSALSSTSAPGSSTRRSGRGAALAHGEGSRHWAGFVFAPLPGVWPLFAVAGTPSRESRRQLPV